MQMSHSLVLQTPPREKRREEDIDTPAVTPSPRRSPTFRLPSNSIGN